MNRTAGRARPAIPARAAAVAAIAVWILTAQTAGATNFLQDRKTKKYMVSVVVRPLPQPHSSTGSGAGSTCHGYVEYRVQIINRDTKRHQVQIRLPGNKSSFGGDYLSDVRQTVDVAPGPPKIVSIFAPGVPLGGSGVWVRVDNESDLVPCDNSYHMEGSDRTGAVLLSRGISDSLRDLAAGQNVSARGNPVSVFRDGEPVKVWSDNWLAYSRFDALMITAAEFGEMPAGVTGAMTRYVECGGSLVVVGDVSVPKSWKPDRRIEGLYYVGFGQCLVGSDYTLLRKGSLLRAIWHGSFLPWQTPHDITDANRIFPVMDDLQVPTKGLFVLMVLFAVAIGPVNLIWLAAKKRRIWMLWTVPTASLVTCLAVFLYATFAEGWSGHRRTETLTLLDQTAQRATTIGWTAFYSPLTPTEGLHFAINTEVSPQIFTDWYSHYGPTPSGTSRTVEYGTDQHLESGWVRARVPAHFMLRRSDSGQAGQKRLIVSESAGRISIVNALGQPLRELYLADAAGNLHYRMHIDSGEKVTLTPMGRKASGSHAMLRALYAADWVGPTQEADLWSATPRGKGALSALRANISTYLMPGSYLALMETTPLVAEGLQDANQHLCRSGVYGIYDPTASDH